MPQRLIRRLNHVTMNKIRQTKSAGYGNGKEIIVIYDSERCLIIWGAFAAL